MLRKGLIAGVFAGMLVAVPLMADVVVRMAPPPPVHERIYRSPGVGYVWTPGYQRWNGRSYAWVHGAWVRPPRPNAHWMAPRWVHRGGGYVYVPGRWR